MPSRKAWTKKRILVALHICVAAIVTALLWVYPPPEGLTRWTVVPWMAYLAAAAALAFVPAYRFASRRFDFVFVTLEALLVGTLLASYFRGETWLFYPLLLLAVLLAALARRLVWAVAMGAAVSATHVLLAFGDVDVGVLILQTALILVTAGLIGFLTEELTREEVSSGLLDNAVEIFTLLAGMLETGEVYERLTQLLAKLFRAGRAAVILVHPDSDTAEVVAAIDRGERISDLKIDLERYPEIRTALERRAPVVIGRPDIHPGMAEVRSTLPGRALSSSILVTPIIQDEKPRGVVFVRLEGTRRPFTDHEIKFCRFMADAAGRALERAEHFAEVAEAARRDSLTGLYNVRVFHRRLAEEVERSDRTGARLSLLMIDADYLKHINDTYGHLAGDRVIRRMGAILLDQVRGIDTVARYGGEEFGLLLPETGSERAYVVAERLRARIEHADYESISEPVSVSIGVATYPDDANTPTDLLHKADQALYASKNRGRNRTTQYARMEEPETGRVSEEAAETEPGEVARVEDEALVDSLRGALQSVETGPDMGRQIDVVTSLASVMQAKDPTAFDQLRTVATISDLFLAHLPLAERQRQTIRYACLLRDIGKLAISDELLQKRDFLTREEYRRVRQHPEISARILAPLPGFEGTIPYILHHHERWDGKGYPEGLRGEEIPYGARIVGLIDAFHAMVRRRPYADRARGFHYACEEIRRNAGTQFDPELSERFLFVVDSNRDILTTLAVEDDDEALAADSAPDSEVADEASAPTPSEPIEEIESGQRRRA